MQNCCGETQRTKKQSRESAAKVVQIVSYRANCNVSAMLRGWFGVDRFGGSAPVGEGPAGHMTCRREQPRARRSPVTRRLVPVGRPRGRTANGFPASCSGGRRWLKTPPRVISSVVERFVHIEDVRSSNLLSPTIYHQPCPLQRPVSPVIVPFRTSRMQDAPLNRRGDPP